MEEKHLQTTLYERIRALPLGKIALLLGGVFLLFFAARFFDAQEIFLSALLRVENAGAAGPAILFVLYMISCLLMLPSLILTIGAGSIFGVLKGTLLVSVCSTAGASAAFLTGRYLARERIARRFGRNESFRLIDEAVAAEGWKIVFLTRLSPAFPFNVQNYLYGLSGVSFRDYVLASWIGMIPGTVMYAYIGSLAADLATLGAEGRARTPAEWGLTIAGFIATVAVTVLVTRIARRALRRRIPQSEESKEEEIS